MSTGTNGSDVVMVYVSLQRGPEGVRLDDRKSGTRFGISNVRGRGSTE